MLLFIDACVRGEQSRTKALCNYFLDSYMRLHPKEERVDVQVGGGRFLPLGSEAVAQRDAHVQAQAWHLPQFDAARQFAQADKIVIGAPYWDVSFPAALKCYIEHICVNGIAFRYTQTGVETLCKAQAMLYITTAGGNMEHANHGFTYLQDLFASMFGTARQECVSAQMLDVQGQNTQAILAAARAQLDEVARRF